MCCMIQTMPEDNQNQEQELTDAEIEAKLAARGSFKDRILGADSKSENIVMPNIVETKVAEPVVIEKKPETIIESPVLSVAIENTIPHVEPKIEKLIAEKNIVLDLKVKTNIVNAETERFMEADRDSIANTNDGAPELNIIETDLKFPADFLWGVSTSAYQIEGGIVNDWSVWEKSLKRVKKLQKKGLNPTDFQAGSACDSYRRYEEDFDCALSVGANSFRLGIEWARLEPQQDTHVVSEINHYIEVLKVAKKRGLKTIVTLWHWTLPVWVAEMGGWSNAETVEKFQKYTDMIVREMGGYIDYWVTLNEPMMHVLAGYIAGYFPPNKHNIFKSQRVFKNLVAGHIAAYKKIHYHFPTAQVSLAQIVNHIEPANKFNLLEWAISGIYHYWWNHRFLAQTKKYLDFIGVDYYFHDRIVWRPPFKKNFNKKTSDLGWEIYPEGIYHVLKYLAKFEKPVIILENGIADADDKYRADFIREHLKYVRQAMDEGVDVRGYFHWSLLDNFEWALGWTPKFGLFSVDRETGERKMRASAEVYKKIIRNK